MFSTAQFGKDITGMMDGHIKFGKDITGMMDVLQTIYVYIKFGKDIT